MSDQQFLPKVYHIYCAPFDNVCDSKETNKYIKNYVLGDTYDVEVGETVVLFSLLAKLVLTKVSTPTGLGQAKNTPRKNNKIT